MRIEGDGTTGGEICVIELINNIIITSGPTQGYISNYSKNEGIARLKKGGKKYNDNTCLTRHTCLHRLWTVVFINIQR